MYNFSITPFKTLYKESKEYQLKKDDNYYTFLIRKTKDKILINSNYYEISFNHAELSNLTRINFGKIDEAYTFLNNLFNKNFIQIKRITSNIIELELIINNSQNQRVNLCLSENLNNQYYLFKDLYQKQIKLTKELNFLKEDNFKLRQENMHLNNSIISLKNNFINEMDQIKKQINFINQKLFSSNDQVKNIEKNVDQLIKFQQYNLQNNQDQFRANIQQQMMIQNKRIEELNSILRGNSISVLFKNPNGVVFPVKCYEKELCSEMFKKYKNKDKDFSNDDNLSYLFNGKNLEENLNLYQYGITNGSIIFVIN